MNELNVLSHQGLADIDRKSASSLSLGNYTGMVKRFLNRHQIKLTSRTRQYWYLIQFTLV
jgi:hypothetical protein